MSETPAWPEDRVDQALLALWDDSCCTGPAGEMEILQVKSWGVTARFGHLVAKVSFTPLFPQVEEVHAVLEKAVPGGVPRLVATRKPDGQLWTLFENLAGPTAEEVGSTDGLVSMARALAVVQSAAAREDLSRIPAIEVCSVPGLLLDDLADQPAELVEWLHDAQPDLRADAKALEAIPPSLDHPDMNWSNAILAEDGRVVILDWEEATAGCPLFSLDRLLHDARELDAVEEVIDAYLDAFPRAGREEVETAMRLVPLKLAVEARAFARGLGWEHPHTRYTTRLLEQARSRRVRTARP